MNATSTERPILFIGPMVRAILAGKKAQTRRIVNPHPRFDRSGLTEAGWVRDGRGRWCFPNVCPEVRIRSPYGAPGDTLWVRETHYVESAGYPDGSGRHIFYRADDQSAPIERWTPSIFMPRFASRLSLRVLTVHIERLKQIGRDDARAEGLARLTKDGGRTWKYGLADRDGLPGNDDDGWHWREWDVDPRKAFAKAWDSINGKRAPWSSNPWVWVVTFEVSR